MGQNAAISACANASAWKQALAAFQRVKDKDVVTYNATITSCTKGRQTSRSLRLFKEMKDLKVSPDVVTLGAILNACEKGASWADAVSLLLQEKQPSIVLFNMVASSCAKGHQWQHALWILREVRRQRLRADATSFNSVMAACLRGEEWEHSLSLFQELKCLNAMLTLPSYVEALGSFHQAQRWEAALQTFLEVPKPDLQVLGAAFRAAGSWQQALCFLNTYSAESDTICTLLTLAAVDQAGQGHRLTELTRRLRRDLLRCVRAGELRGAEATAVHFLMVLGLMDAGDSCQAQELEHYFRSLCKTVYEPALQHCRDRSWDTQISIVDEWSSFEMASRDAASLLGFRPGSMLSRSERNVKYGEKRPLRGIELGCGTGVAGFGLAFLGHQVLLTDIGAEQAAATQGNIAQNMQTLAATGGSAQYGHLDWRQLPERSQYGRFDLVLASDVIWHESLVEPFLQAVSWATSGPGAEEVILSHKARDQESIELFHKMLGPLGLALTSQVPSEQVLGEHGHPDVQLYHLQRVVQAVR